MKADLITILVILAIIVLIVWLIRAVRDSTPDCCSKSLGGCIP